MLGTFVIIVAAFASLIYCRQPICDYIGQALTDFASFLATDDLDITPLCLAAFCLIMAGPVALFTFIVAGCFRLYAWLSTDTSGIVALDFPGSAYPVATFAPVASAEPTFPLAIPVEARPFTLDLVSRDQVRVLNARRWTQAKVDRWCDRRQMEAPSAAFFKAAVKNRLRCLPPVPRVVLGCAA